MTLLLIGRFLKWGYNVKTLLKGEQIQLPERKFYRKKTIIGKLIISNSNKMQPLLNASKAWQTIPADSLKKWEPSEKHTNTN